MSQFITVLNGIGDWWKMNWEVSGRKQLWLSCCECVEVLMNILESTQPGTVCVCCAILHIALMCCATC